MLSLCLDFLDTFISLSQFLSSELPEERSDPLSSKLLLEECFSMLSRAEAHEPLLLLPQQSSQLGWRALTRQRCREKKTCKLAMPDIEVEKGINLKTLVIYMHTFIK